MSKQDYYELLGIDKNASDAEIKKAFRKKAKQYHPDQNPGDETAKSKFQAVGEAYEVLKDTQKRAMYDQYGHAAFEQGGGQAGGAGGFNFSDMGGFSDVFEDLFSEFMGSGRSRGGRRNSTRKKGSDIHHNLSISLEDSFHGKKLTIEVPGTVSCGSCKGTGSADGKPPVTCKSCHGHGVVRMQQGFFTVERTCPTCHGEGVVIANPCTNCRGNGYVSQKRNLDIAIPAGIEGGTRIRMQGEGGHAPQKGISGDLYLTIDVKSHKIFEREGENLHCSMPISMINAALGGNIEVPTIDGGRARVTIPDGTQTGKQFRLRGKGMPVLRSSHVGDLYIHVSVETPVNLTKKQKELLQEFSEQSPAGNNSPGSSSFFSRVKEFWDGITN